MRNVAEQLLMALLACSLSSGAAAVSPADRSPSELEQRLKGIDTQLTQLATYSLGSGIGAIGSRSQPHETKDHPEWLEIDFGRTFPLDEVMLVPAIRRDSVSGFQADGFPTALRLVAGTGEDRAGKVVAEYTSQDGLLPRIAPLIIPCKGTAASWIRIEARTLSLRAFDKNYVFQLSEVLAFSGQGNVALHKPVRSSAGDNPVIAPGWDDSYLVDGFLPYLMAVAQGKQSVAYLSAKSFPGNPILTIDLGARYPLSSIHLHAVDQSDTVPQAFAGDFGIPTLLRVEGANEPDFSDAKMLIELHHDTIYDIGPIMMWAFPETTCRYVRLKVVEPNLSALYGPLGHPLGFAEIELFAGGRNVALNKPVTANLKHDSPLRVLSNMTDGLNFYGTILPVRDWLNQLARRHELERERPRLVAELNRQYARQKAMLTLLIRLTVLLAVGVVVIVLVARVMRQRAIERIRKRIAADLHDELGADLHAIGLLSDLAQTTPAPSEKLNDLLRRIRSLTEHTGKAARHCTNMLEAKGLYGDLVDDMRRASDRILADLKHEIEIEGAGALRNLSPPKRTDLFLFYQECLINIIRHSGATSVLTRLVATDGGISLTVSDNGHGLNGEVPGSLKRRARLLGADVSAGPSDSKGTRIHLRLKTRTLGMLK